MHELNKHLSCGCVSKYLRFVLVKGAHFQWPMGQQLHTLRHNSLNLRNLLIEIQHTLRYAHQERGKRYFPMTMVDASIEHTMTTFRNTQTGVPRGWVGWYIPKVSTIQSYLGCTCGGGSKSPQSNTNIARHSTPAMIVSWCSFIPWPLLTGVRILNATCGALPRSGL